MLGYSFNSIADPWTLSEPVFIPNTHHVGTDSCGGIGVLILFDSFRPRNAPPPSPGVGDRVGEGDCGLVLEVLPPDLAEVAFENMRKEVAWNVMYHRGMSGAYTPLTCAHVVRYSCSRWGSAPTGGGRGGHRCGRKVSETKGWLLPTVNYIHLFHHLPLEIVFRYTGTQPTSPPHFVRFPRRSL